MIMVIITIRPFQSDRRCFSMIMIGFPKLCYPERINSVMSESRPSWSCALPETCFCLAGSEKFFARSWEFASFSSFRENISSSTRRTSLKNHLRDCTSDRSSAVCLASYEKSVRHSSIDSFYEKSLSLGLGRLFPHETAVAGPE